MRNDIESPRPFVVAFDASDESVAALAWATGRARRDNRPIRIVTAYPPPDAAADSAGGYLRGHEAAESAVRSTIEAAARPLVEGLPIEYVVASGGIEPLLLAQSEEAYMIVVGTRATHTWSSRFRRSLTNRITGKVSCPVVSVPLTSSRRANPPRPHHALVSA